MAIAVPSSHHPPITANYFAAFVSFSGGYCPYPELQTEEVDE